MTTTQSRIKNNLFYEAYRIFIKNEMTTCDKFNEILKNTKILSKIGNESKYGDVYSGMVMEKVNKIPISIKRIPMTLIDLQILLENKQNDRTKIFGEKTIWKEIYILRLCMKLIKMKKCIHLPLHFFYVYTSSNHLTKNISKTGPYLYVYNELANEDLKSWSTRSRTHNEWISCFLQIFFALYVLQYYCGFMHNDLHWGNILVFHVKKGGCWCYTIENKNYYIYNEGYLFVLWDFGLTTIIPPMIECKEHPKACQDFFKILNTPKWIRKYYCDVSIPKSISDLCLFIRSEEYKSMKELLHQVITKFCHVQKTYILETYSIHCKKQNPSKISNLDTAHSIPQSNAYGGDTIKKIQHTIQTNFINI